MISNVEAQNVFLGSDWNSSVPLQNLAGKLDAAMSTMVSGTQTDGLTLAGYNVYRGTSSPGAVGNVALDKSYPASGFGNGLFSFVFDPQGNIIGITQNLGSTPVFKGGIADDPTMVGYSNSIQGLLQTMVNTGQLQTPDSNTLYSVYVEPGVIVSMAQPSGATGQPSNSVIDFAGYHGAFAGTTAGGAAVNIRYAVMPFPGFPNTVFGLTGSGGSTQNLAGAFNSLTTTASHELSEAITDPDVSFANSTGNTALLGWYDDVNNGEVADLSANAVTIAQGYELQLSEDQNNLTINPNAVTHTLDAPTNVALTNLTSTSAKLSWNSSSLAQGYRVFEVNGSQNVLIATLGASTTTYQITGLTPGATVSFIVEAFDGPTTADSSDPTATLPAAPASVTSNSNTPVATNGITVSNFTIAGQMAQVIQSGSNTLAFVNEHGNVVVGSYLNPTQVIVAGWGNDVATFSAGKITWSDGSVWTLTTAAASQLTVTDFTNSGNGGTTHEIQNGTNTVVFVNELGNVVLGSLANSTTAIVAAWGNDVATFGAGKITWSDGSVWKSQSTAAPASSPLTVTDYTNAGNGLTAHVIQNGTNTVVFVNEQGDTVLGTMTSPTQAVVGAWGNDVATFSNGKINWSDGSVWTQASAAASHLVVTDYVNSGNGQKAHTIATGTNTLIFVNEAGTFALGTMTSSTQAKVSAWGNDIATFNARKVNWSDGSLWTAL